jgi:hypothetical protein
MSASIAERIREVADDIGGRRDAYDPTRGEMAMSGTELRRAEEALNALAAELEEKAKEIRSATEGRSFVVSETIEKINEWADSLGRA